MIRFFLKRIVPFIVALAVLIEGTSFGLNMLSWRSDVAVIAGLLLVLGTISVFLSFIWSYYLAPSKSFWDRTSRTF
jgi:type IV secretory pathway VirB2 component (pilin)